ncbi:MAG: NAD(P)/FAD-dependent oxidoreductase, partial [Gemmataceae bacterium]
MMGDRSAIDQPPQAPPQRTRVVIIGGGFAGLYCARGLAKAPVDVTLIDRRNFHLFQPLLYQVATGALSPANIASPLRALVRNQNNTRVLLGEVADFALTPREVILTDGERIPFDRLVVAAGSTHHYFGKDAQWEPLAPGLKTIEDATEIRRKVLSAFERAEREPDEARRKRALTFVVVGGGPTGVEVAGALAELARQTLRREFRTFDSGFARVVLVEGQTRILPVFHETHSAYAAKTLNKMGVEILFDSHVTTVETDHVILTSDQTKATTRIDTETVIWAAGVKASPLGRKLADKLSVTAVDRGGRVTIGPDCSIPGNPDFFILGDMGSQAGADGKPLPGLAPVAMQQGEYVAEVLTRQARGQSPRAGFKYWDKGTMATIGRSRAVAESYGIRFTGMLAWLAW